MLDYSSTLIPVSLTLDGFTEILFMFVLFLTVIYGNRMGELWLEP